MQCVGDSTTHKGSQRLLGPALGDQKQGSFSINLWKNAFHDAFRRLCPVRAGGHECGCLSVLARKVHYLNASFQLSRHVCFLCLRCEHKTIMDV